MLRVSLRVGASVSSRRSSRPPCTLKQRSFLTGTWMCQRTAQRFGSRGTTTFFSRRVQAGQETGLGPIDTRVSFSSAGLARSFSSETTACVVARLPAVISVIERSPSDSHRNIFLNLAVPIMQASEPGEVAKIELVHGLFTCSCSSVHETTIER